MTAPHAIALSLPSGIMPRCHFASDYHASYCRSFAFACVVCKPKFGRFNQTSWRRLSDLCAGAKNKIKKRRWIQLEIPF
jgi:hypothetical protein